MQGFQVPNRLAAKSTIFVVEQNADDRNSILRALRESPFVGRVHWFRTGDRMLRFFGHDRYYDDFVARAPFLILMDANISGTPALKILQQLKKNPLTAYIPAAIVSRGWSDAVRERAYRLRASAYIPKPVSLGRIHDVMLTGKSWPPVWARPAPLWAGAKAAG